jgi:hypothetical protein
VSDCSCGFDPGKRPNAFEKLAKEDGLLEVGIPVSGQRNLHRQKMVRFEARVHGVQADKTAKHEAGTYKEDER